jgi:excisionase family DNA binding protein
MPQAVTEPTAADARTPLLYTPTQAAELLAVRESWLRRMAGKRAIPCTFLGKHLRFSEHDLRRIVLSGAQETQRTRGTRRK